MFGKSKDKQEKPSNKQLQDDYVAFIKAEEELKQLRIEHGIEDPNESKLSKKLTNYFDKRENRELVPVSKKKYIILALLTGWMGGHRFYCKHYKVGLTYLLLFWMGIGLYHSILDLMIVIPMQPDENGKILL